MATQAAILDHIRATNDRLNRALDRRVAREYLAFADEAEQAEQERRDRVLRHGDAIRRHQARYDGAFSSFGEQTPQPINGEYPGDYRRGLFAALQRKLPPDHDLAGVDPEELGTSLIGKLEPELLEAAGDEAERPSEANLPRDGSMLERSRMDSRTGARTINFYGRESFIKAMGAQPRRGFAFHGRDGLAIWPPQAQAAGFVKQPLVRGL
jgi:hypothetical protein